MGFHTPDKFTREDMTERRLRRIMREEIERALELKELFEEMKQLATTQEADDAGL